MVDAPQSFSEWVWTDTNFMQTLNSEQMRKRQSKHICPLPFDIVERCIDRYTNPGELVLDPFAGLFTVPYTAMKLGRVGYGIELNHDYFAAGVKYCEAMQREVSMPTLFDFFNVPVDYSANLPGEISLDDVNDLLDTAHGKNEQDI